MLHVCTNENRELYRTVLTEMHRHRCELFVKSKGWNLTVRDDGGEYDEGDDARAVYLLALSQTGTCIASIRLRPADDFSMVIDRMPHHVHGDAHALRAEPGLWEMARMVNAGGPRVGQELRIGLIEHLLHRGARQCLALPDVDMMAYAIRTGWRLRSLGAPLPYPEGGVAVAASLPITQAEAAHLRAVTGRTDPFLIEIDVRAPWSRLPLPQIEAAYLASAADAVTTDDLAERADQRLRRQVDFGQVA